ncbi:hypothetical protein HDU96_009438, partial [Phlyctochytrium bullatum]
MAHGSGLIDLTASENGPASFTHLAFSYPLRLISPTPHPSKRSHRSVYMLSHGGGLLSGDCIHLYIKLTGPCSLSLLTQGSTKVFKKPRHGTAGRSDDGARQHLRMMVATGALLCILPDVVSPFADSSYFQEQIIDLESKGSSLLLLDWFSAGRVSRGEIWDFSRYESRIRIFVDRKIEIFRDSWLLEDDGAEGPNGREDGVTSKQAMNRPRSYLNRVRSFNCFATLILIGPRLRRLIDAAVANFEHVKISRRSSSLENGCMWSLSPIQDVQAAEGSNDRGIKYGVVLRFAGMETLDVKKSIVSALK